MPHVLAPWRRNRRHSTSPARLCRLPVAPFEPLESRVLLCADHSVLAQDPAGATFASLTTAQTNASPIAPVTAATPTGAPDTAEPIIAAAAVPTGFIEQQLATGITSPTAIEIAPDGRVFVSEQTGNVRVFKDGQLLATPFVTVTEDSYFE